MILRLGLAVTATEKFAHGLSIFAWGAFPMAVCLIDGSCSLSGGLHRLP